MIIVDCQCEVRVAVTHQIEGAPDISQDAPQNARFLAMCNLRDLIVMHPQGHHLEARILGALAVKLSYMCLACSHQNFTFVPKAIYQVQEHQASSGCAAS